MSAPLGLDALVRLARDLGRPQSTLTVLSHGADPFGIGTATHVRNAEWFAALWREHMPARGGHLRRLHYRLVSQGSAIAMPDGQPYINTFKCWIRLPRAGKWARHLDLIDADVIDDRRSPEPRIYLQDETVIVQPTIEFTEDEYYEATLPFISEPKLPDLPRLNVHRPLSAPVVVQRYHLEVWVEKSDVEDVVLPIARTYRLNYCQFIGQAGIKPCRDLVERAERSGRPVRILYISDFDPQGESMPVAVARKIEFAMAQRDLHLDIQVIPLALTDAQCIDFGLPRTPLKKTDPCKGRFEERHGEGATELDALEALYPGMLRRILLEAIERYHDDTLSDRVDEAFDQPFQGFSGEAEAFNNSFDARYERELDKLRNGLRDILEALEPIRHQLKPIQKQARAWRHRVEEVYQAIADELESEAPDFDGVDWPEPAEGSEHPNPLFDSRRSYLEQIEVYKRHQGRPTEKRTRKDKGGTWSAARRAASKSKRRRRPNGGAP